MRILVLGGSVFLSKAAAADAVARGHEVTCVTRGHSGEVPEGARHVVWDRADDVPADLAAEDYDAVVDCRGSRRACARPSPPGRTRTGCSCRRSTCTPTTRRRTRARQPARRADHEDHDLKEDPESYGPMKVACEQTCRRAPRVDGRPAGADRRPRRPDRAVHGYWPVRLADGGDGARPRRPGRPDAGHRRPRPGGVDRPTARERHDRRLRRRRPGQPDRRGARRRRATGVGADPSHVVPARSSSPSRASSRGWATGRCRCGCPGRSTTGWSAHRFDVSEAAGLAVRSIADTARDTLAWMRATPDAARTGMSRERESEVLRWSRAALS